MTVIYRFNKYLIAMLIIVMLTGCGSEADIENSGVLFTISGIYTESGDALTDLDKDSNYWNYVKEKVNEAVCNIAGVESCSIEYNPDNNEVEVSIQGTGDELIKQKDDIEKYLSDFFGDIEVNIAYETY